MSSCQLVFANCFWLVPDGSQLYFLAKVLCLDGYADVTKVRLKHGVVAW